MNLPAVILALSWVCGTSPSSEIEARAWENVASRFERSGRTLPALDPRLSRAARTLANAALSTPAGKVADVDSLTDAVSSAGAFDPSPKTLVFRATPPDQLLSSVRKLDLERKPLTHLGIGSAVRGGTGALVILAVRRSLSLSPYPRHLAQPQDGPPVCGQLSEDLSRPELFITLPDGRVEQLAFRGSKDRFCATPHWGRAGRYAVEILGQGAQGPEVAGLFFVDVGPNISPFASTAAAAPKPPANLPSRPEILARINQLRAAQHVATFQSDPILEKVAQDYAVRMAKEGFFAHVSPDGGDLRARLRAAGYSYRAAGENLGMAKDVSTAHLGIEHSPGHRKNLLNPRFTQVGIGLFEQRTPEGPQVVLVEVYASR